MINKQDIKPDGYFKGFAYRLTGKTLSLYGGMYKEVVILEGFEAGKNKVIKSLNNIANNDF